MELIADHRPDNPLRRKLIEALVAFNDRNGPSEDWRFVGFYALDGDGELEGGLQGAFEWDWLHVTHLWARERGKRGLFLDTLAFQARPFYEKLGFAVIGTIEGAAGEHARYFMAKRLR